MEGCLPSGFAYLPPVSGFYDGIVLHRRVFGIGEEYDLLNNYDLNKSLTHEMGHYLGLYHTFRLTNGCAEESNCNAQGDQICDTPPTTGSAGCSALDCPETMVENYMDYGYDQCVHAFTEGQRSRMRSALLDHRESLLVSQGTVPVVAQDAGVASIQGIGAGRLQCHPRGRGLLAEFRNRGHDRGDPSLFPGRGLPLAVGWSGELDNGMSTLVPLPALAAGQGTHTLSVWSSMTVDDYAQNDTLTVDFDVVPGTWLSMEIQFDFLPHGISGPWSTTTWAWSCSKAATISMMNMRANSLKSRVRLGRVLYPDRGGSLRERHALLPTGMVLSLGLGWQYSRRRVGQLGAEQTHGFCVEGSSVEPCVDVDGNGVCDEAEGELQVTILGCTDPLSCTFDAEANTDDGSCDYLDALGDCGGDCEADDDGDGICDSEEVPGCTDETACNYDPGATEEDGNCDYAAAGYDCDGNPLVSSVGNLEAGPTLSAFPNPSVDGVFRIGGFPGPGPHPLTILDLNGRLVHAERAEAMSTAAGWTLQPNIPKGRSLPGPGW